MSQSHRRADHLPLAMRRVLIVEDSSVIAAKLSLIVASAGAEIVGPVATVASAINAIATVSWIDAAVLDVDLRGELVFGVAEALVARQVPLLFLTGYDLKALPEPWRAWPLMQKPFASTDVVNAVRAAIKAGPRRLDVTPSQTLSLGDRRRSDAVNASRNLIMESRIIRNKD
ncbi:response regulator [Bradyrhizobium jicamae]|uniref:Response regulator n=1 Tax=Bradyrhizobium jicamae TaxID=280332 RepID=A0ABS5FW67_9BRAD|nr:response regulator [Bradyrhizobium jicamae]MBR0800814.1 response regulator [Bradyrhizobium jicamae]MBR0938715.1 response regulator [Bradyrhizobium jicamae]